MRSCHSESYLTVSDDLTAVGRRTGTFDLLTEVAR
jgi:hypothetical protein